ncbi:MAG: hypothetical protein V1778_02010 [bacterium]
MRRVLFIIVSVLMVVGAATSCCITKHPLVEAFTPKYIGETLTREIHISGTANIHAKLPLLLPANVHVETDGAVTIITVTPPFDPRILERVVDEQKGKGQSVTVVGPDGKEIKP